MPTMQNPTCDVVVIGAGPNGLTVAVENGSDVDASAMIEGHIERFAPGFREIVPGRATRNARQMERHNPNYIGGDINGGSPALWQLIFRPIASVDPYATAARNIFLCSSSTPPAACTECAATGPRAVSSDVCSKGSSPPDSRENRGDPNK
jgi:phytoene dehydrogenase-like protein